MRKKRNKFSLTFLTKKGTSTANKPYRLKKKGYYLNTVFRSEWNKKKVSGKWKFHFLTEVYLEVLFVFIKDKKICIFWVFINIFQGSSGNLSFIT